MEYDYQTMGISLPEYLNIHNGNQIIGLRYNIDFNPKIIQLLNPKKIIKTKTNIYGTCELTEHIKIKIREQMKYNIIFNTKNNIDIIFSHQLCEQNYADNIVMNYRDKMLGAIEAYGKIDRNTHKIIFNEKEPLVDHVNTKKEGSPIIKVFKHLEVPNNDVVNEHWQTLKKYNKINDDIIKIKLFVNENEYKIIPYKGEINNNYYKKLLTHKFDMFPNIKIKN